MPFVYLLTGLLIGALAAWTICRAKAGADAEAARREAESALLPRLREAEQSVAGADALITELRSHEKRYEDETARLRAELDSERRRSADSLARLDEAQRAVAEQKAFIENIEKRLADTFKALSMQALSQQSELGAKELDGKKQLIDQSIEAIGKRMAEMQGKFEQLNQTSIERIDHVSHSIRQHMEATGRLAETTEGLRRTLASAKKRGEWGERMAEDIIRLVGMVEGINYLKQKTMEHSAGRPDYTFLLPRDLKINMDVKFPMDNYLLYLEAESEQDRARLRGELVRNARTMITQVTGREYIDPRAHTVDYVLVFIPNEQVYAFLNESDTGLMDFALSKKVILCSPFTLYAVLAVIRQSVENFNLEQTASEILKLLASFGKQWDAYKERFDALGKRLDDARKDYDHLALTRTIQLERPLRKIEELRRQRAIPLDDQTTAGE